jgi:hypothetical protein
MHIDESKKFDKRNIERNLKEKIITQKEYENYLAKLLDVSDKIYIPDESEGSNNEDESDLKKKKIKRKSSKG